MTPTDRPASAMSAAPCRHPAFPTAREARRRAWALQPNPALRQTPVECRWCGAWRLAEPGQTND